MAAGGFPHAYSSHNRIFAVVLAFDFNRIESILAILSEYRNICEAGWHPTIYFLTSMSMSARFHRYLSMKTYCYRIQRSLSIEFKVYDPSENVYVSEHNREHIREHLHDHDLFVYQEEDIVLTLGHLTAYLEETRRLMQMGEKRQPGKKGADEMLRQYMIGFHRYYRIRQSSEKRDPKEHILTEREIFRLENLNEHPFFVPICLRGKPYLQTNTSKYYYNGNPHQGVYMLTRRQVEIFDKQCNFLNQTIKNYPERTR